MVGAGPRAFTGPCLPADELAAMNQVSRGTKASNLAKLVGRLGFSEGQAVTILNPLAGGAAAAAAFGTPAGVAVPIIGQASKQLAQRLTAGNARFADQLIRAGNNAENIARAYIRNTPKSKQSALELSGLLMDNVVDLDAARSALAKEAARLARQARQAALVGAVPGGLEEE